MIKLIVFDFGDVLVKDTFKALRLKYDNKRLSKTTRQLYVRSLHQINIGEIDEYEFIRRLQKTLVPKLSLGQIHKILLETKLLPPWNLAHKLKKHYIISIWTNNHKTGPASFSKILRTPFAEFPIVNSAYIGSRKPQRAFYIKAMKLLKVKPKELIFIDDSPDNVLAAKKLGIAAFRYQGNMRLLKLFLKRQGITGL